ncbi:MAG TPA: argininosuccinate lyase [Bacillota bacterium]|nr:argininosuccinate lyase [Bacillota bacterium]
MAEKMWGGRFSSAGGREAEKFTASIGFDRRLWRQDIAGSKAHAKMLGQVGVLAPSEVALLLDGLERVAGELQAGTFPFRVEFEDIHLNIERRLTELVGPVGGKLHTARSRNDQVALDMHLYVKDIEALLIEGVRALQGALRDQARSAYEARIVMPGFTHLQHAQPVPLALHWLAYWHMLERDVERLSQARDRADRSPLGAAALAGTSFPVDPEMVAKDLGLAGVYANSMDAVSDRDFVLDLLSAASVLMVHLSRLGEELVLWSSREFGFIEVDDAFATGSSIMPQKKNPDVAELVRGKSGRVFGDLLTLLTVLKGLPLAYHSDMQEDKEACFDAIDTVEACLDAMTGMVATLRPRADRMKAALARDWSGATDLADALAKRGMPFRDAHAVAGTMVRVCGDRDPESLTDDELRSISPLLKREDIGLLDPGKAVAARQLFSRVAEDLR